MNSCYFTRVNVIKNMQLIDGLTLIKVHLSFLPVGHTHEDVDAAFSRIAETLRRNDAETMPRLKEMLPNVKDIEAIYDIRSWITSSLNDIQHTEQKWWGGFLGHLEKIRDSLPYRRTKVLSKAKWILPLLPKQQLKRQGPSVDQDIPAELRRLLENEREECFITKVEKSCRKFFHYHGKPTFRASGICHIGITQKLCLVLTNTIGVCNNYLPLFYNDLTKLQHVSMPSLPDNFIVEAI
ncbi:unnamed protein product [Mytilus edulis]|uniref:DUF7869 domain-containing protein n=1 Tax=Mytilus edulis TaxID=6550 RepID=A0A8S3V9C4_MYTED|nr:unnamed protein product [Mytilus edulis]